jgi:hypothetical protein
MCVTRIVIGCGVPRSTLTSPRDRAEFPAMLRPLKALAFLVSKSGANLRRFNGFAPSVTQ